MAYGLTTVLILFLFFLFGNSKPNVPDVGLSSNVLRHILFVEPNLHLQQLGNVSDIDGRLKRTFLDTGHRRAANVLQRWMSAAGMATWTDPVANVHGRAHSAHPGAPAMLVGSHYDTVIDGGRFDGALGIVAGIAAVKALVLEAAVRTGTLTNDQIDEAVMALQATPGPDGAPGILDVDKLLMQHLRYVGRPMLRRPVEVVAFSDEEGVRFQSTFLGSRALAGTLANSGALDTRDSSGSTLLDALRAKGLADSVDDIRSAALTPGSLAGYVEVHLEQGPVLESTGVPLGVVDGIAGQTRLLIEFTGEQGHAGTVPMWLRRDPLAGAAEFMVDIETACKIVSGVASAVSDASAYGKDDGLADVLKPGSDRTMVCTVGSMGLWPGASNVIPGTVNITLDIRSQSDESKSHILTVLSERMEATCQRRGLQCRTEKRFEMKAVKSDARMAAALDKAVNGSFGLVESVGAAQLSWLSERPRPPSPSPQTLAVTGNATAGSMSCSSDGLSSSCEQPGRGSDKDDATADAPTSRDGVLRLTSGAGHDAMSMATVAPMGMLFVRCAGGISHSPSEWVSPEDVAAGTAALLEFLRDWQMQDDVNNHRR